MTTDALDLEARLALLDHLQQHPTHTVTVGESELARWASQQLGRAYSDVDIEAALAPPATGLAELPPIRATIVDAGDTPEAAEAPAPLADRVLQTLQWGHALPAVSVGLVSGAVLPAVVGVPVMAAGVVVGCYSWAGSLGQRWLATVAPEGPHGAARRLFAWAVPTTLFKRTFPWGKRWRQTNSADA